MFNLRRVLAVAIIASVVILTTVIYQHLQQQSPAAILALLPDNIDLALEDLHYTQNEDGKRSWTLDASKAEYLRDSNLVKLDAVKLTFYNAGDFGEVELQADNGELLQETNQVDIWGDVIITTGRGEQMFTERLHYDDSLKQISTAEAVKIVTSQVDMTGIGMEVSIDDGRFLLKKQVHAILYPVGREKI